MPISADTDSLTAIQPCKPTGPDGDSTPHWSQLLCWALWFPQLITVLVDPGGNSSPARPSGSRFPFLPWYLRRDVRVASDGAGQWHQQPPARALLGVAVRIALGTVLALALLFSLTFVHRLLPLSRPLFLALLTCMLTGVAVAGAVTVAMAYERPDALIVTVILVTPAFFLIAFVWMVYVMRLMAPPLLLTGLITIPFGMAGGSLFAIADKDLPRLWMATKYTLLVLAAFAFGAFTIQAVACGLPWDAIPLAPTGAACPQTIDVGSMLRRALGVGTAAALGAAMGLLRVDDWLFSRLAPRNGLRKCSGWPGPRVSPIPAPGLQEGMRQALHQDWATGLNHVNAVWYWTNQRDAAVKSVQHLLAAYEEAGAPQKAFMRIRQTAEAEPNAGWSLTSLATAEPGARLGRLAQKLGYVRPTHRYQQTALGFQALRVGRADEALIRFSNGLSGGASQEYIALCRTLIAVEDGDEQRMTAAAADIDQWSGASLNGREQVWRVLNDLHQSRRVLNVLADIPYQPAAIEQHLSNLTTCLQGARQAIGQAQVERWTEARALATCYVAHEREQQTYVRLFEYDPATRRIRQPA